MPELLPLLHRHRLKNAAVALCLWCLMFCAWAAPPLAGTLIENMASARFVDVGSGLPVQINSNRVRLNVLALEACTLSSNQSALRAPGQAFALPHTLTHTGNAGQYCQITATLAAGSAYTPQQLQVVRDLNGSGVVNPGEPVLGPGDKLWMLPGEAFGLLVTGLVPPGTPAGQSAVVQVRAVSSAQSQASSNTDTITVVEGPVLTLTKSASLTNPTPGAALVYTLTLSNVGKSAASGTNHLLVDGTPQGMVLLRDGIPANTTFVSLQPAGTAMPLFHRAGDNAASYLSAPPANGSVDAVAWAMPSLAAGASLSARLTVQVNANATGMLDNTAFVDYSDAGYQFSTPSNPVQLPLPANRPEIHFYRDNGYTAVAAWSPLSVPLFLQFNAAACNTDPAHLASLPVRLTSQLSGDLETFNAIETGPNTGIFRIQPHVPTANASRRPVVTGDGILELLPNDLVSAVVTGCAAIGAIDTQVLIDPQGVVYDSKTNAPVTGATVRLLTAAGTPATVYQDDGTTAAPYTVVTGTDGIYRFPLVAAGDYRLQITPPQGYAFPSILAPPLQPPGRVLDLVGSYGGNFSVTTAGPVRLDVPLDARATSGLVVQKTVSRTTAEVGDFVDYAVTISNFSGIALSGVALTDWLPAGFRYTPGSARQDKLAVADPPAGGGSVVFALGTLAHKAQTVLTYRALILPEAQSGNGINTAQAQSGALHSNRASVKVTLLGGVFTEQATLIGKVYADCNGNRQQDTDEPGVPGVRIWLADGTYAVTDGHGKYSLYGLTPRTTVVAVDPLTLPPDTALRVLSNRHALDAGSLFADLQKGQLHRADFAIGECTPAVRAGLDARRKALDYPSQITQSAQSLLMTTLQSTVTATDPRALPATGTIGPNGPVAAGAATPTAADGLGAVGDTGGPTQARLTQRPLFASAPAPPAETAAPTPAATPAPLQDLLPTLDAEVGFVGLSDGQIMPTDQTRVQVKGPAGADLLLQVNGQEVPVSQVGLRASLASSGVGGWEYIGVKLRPGSNTLAVSAVDAFGNPRGGTARITLRAPGPLAQLRIVLPPQAVADAQTAAPITVQTLDAQGLPVTTRLPLRLTSSQGLWQVKNLNPDQPGTHVFVEGGQGVYPLLPPANPATVLIQAASGTIESSARLTFTPYLRPLLGVGLIEGVIDFSKLRQAGVAPVQSTDTFERALGNALHRFDHGNASAGLRGQVFLKGKVLGSTLLTLAYDSDKPSSTELFRNLQPDRYYPVYGDASVKGFDAQSTGKLYVRLDHGTSYVLLGDYSTQSDHPARQLSQYSRALNGVKAHGEHGKLTVEGFASHTASTQVVVELAANGTSGPYPLNPNGIVNSQQVSIVTRNRDQPGQVLSEKPMAPLTDYTVESLTGRLLFTAPVPSVDASLNPVSIRVAYELASGGPKHWVGGASAQYQAGDRLNLGASLVRDNDPLNPLSLVGLNATLQLGDKTTLVGEVAASDSAQAGRGNAQRLELRSETATVQVRAWAVQTDAGFHNPSATQSAGQAQYGAQLGLTLDPANRLSLEALRSRAQQGGNEQTGLTAAWQHSLPGEVKLTLGARHASGPAVGSNATGASGNASAEFTSGFVRVDAPVPKLPAATVFAQYEHAFDQPAQAVTVGATYALGTTGKLYLTHQSSNSFSSAYGLNPNVNQYSSVLGLQTTLPDTTQVFNEYRMGNSLDAHSAEDAIGLRRSWQLAPGLNLDASAEHLHPISGTVRDAATALTAALNYTAAENWKASGRLEWRISDQSLSKLVSAAVAHKLDDDWSLLYRGLYSAIDDKTSSGTQRLGQIQGGFAWRPAGSNMWNALGMIGYVRNQNSSLPAGQQIDQRAWTLLTQINLQPQPDWTLSARYAAKHLSDRSNGLESRGWTHLAGARVVYDINDRWDLGAQAYTSWGAGTRRRAWGLEAGYLMARNLWLSVGYNVQGFTDPYLSSGTYTQPGGYLRLRLKFGGDPFEQAGGLMAPAGASAPAAIAPAGFATLESQP